MGCTWAITLKEIIANYREVIINTTGAITWSPMKLYQIIYVGCLITLLSLVMELALRISDDVEVPHNRQHRRLQEQVRRDMGCDMTCDMECEHL